LAKKQGLFVTLEGPDGSGKSTQQALLAEHLRSFGYFVVETREPGGSPTAERIRRMLLDPELKALRPPAELLLFEAARAQHVADTIAPALAKGAVVLCDRFTDSTTAYQGAGRSVDSKSVVWLNRFATAGFAPDLTLLYDLGPKQGLKRARQAKGRRDRMEAADLGFHQRVRARFLRLAKESPRRVKAIGVAGRTPQSVAEVGLKLILERLP
jgi:dTMP kinase